MSSLSEGRTQALTMYFDAALAPRAGSREELEQVEVERLARALAVVLNAGAIPRRLGGDADDAALALDKKRAKRVAHALSGSLRGWTKKKAQLPNDDSIRREGAQLDWTKWIDAHLVETQNRLRFLVTWGVLNDQERWAKSVVVRMENEIRWLTYAMRD